MQTRVAEPTVEVDRLLAIARANADALWMRARRLHADVGERVYARVRSAPDHDVWVIVWGAGSGVELHDHGGSAGAFAVARGTLTDTSEELDGARTERSIGVGEGRSLDPDVRHAVHNASGMATVSVHVYAPPLATMRFYDELGAARDEVVDDGGVTASARRER
jgi:predicted metal-dependent enzyme (double-stranded beta helix superfamily)